MDKISVAFSILVFFAWGGSVFFDKLITSRLGQQGLWLWVLGFIPALLIYVSLLLFSAKFNLDRQGLIFLLASSSLNIIALIFYYLVILKNDLSAAAPLTSLYPVVTVILAFVFLKEPITAVRVVGILFALIAIYLLAK